MMQRQINGDRRHGTGTAFASAVPKSDRIVESYYVCGMVATRKSGLALYAVIPLSDAEAGMLRELDGKLNGVHDVMALSVQRHKILGAHNMETRVFLTSTGAYELSSFVPVKEAEALIARTAEVRFDEPL